MDNTKKPVFRILLVCCLSNPYSDLCIYRVFTNAGVTDFEGYDKLPQMVKQYIKQHSDSDCIFHPITCIYNGGECY